MVGDRLDTDIDGAINAGLDSLAVLSGVTTVGDIANLPPGRRPTFIGPDLSALVRAHPPVAADRYSASCGTATATADGEIVGLTRGESGSIEGLRAAVTLAWALRDRTGRDVRLDGTLNP